MEHRLEHPVRGATKLPSPNRAAKISRRYPRADDARPAGAHTPPPRCCARPAPAQCPFARLPAPTATAAHAATAARVAPPLDYEYYDDEDASVLDVSPLSRKVRIHSDGYIECLDQGNFPHPYSCKQFISCAKMENGDLLGWEYTCPRQLSFDPIGGICNWSAGLGCKE
ncbi:Uncharacterized protein GBIM_13129 [Gryllus bimaculatus]|nr:Uncharacterized protein GBIM_13129 [Gryllus bimaculatus]